MSAMSIKSINSISRFRISEVVLHSHYPRWSISLVSGGKRIRQSYANLMIVQKVY